MSDRLTPAERSLRMAAVRQKNTGPEIFVRQLIHRAGFRFKLSNQQLPGSPDILLVRWRKAIFVNGCFWHGHDCHLFKLPATRTAWWAEKVHGNRLRDQRAEAELAKAGWRIVTVWQCALKGKHKLGVSALQELLVEAIQSRAQSIDICEKGLARGMLLASRPYARKSWPTPDGAVAPQQVQA